jgi:hypothetical protein
MEMALNVKTKGFSIDDFFALLRGGTTFVTLRIRTPPWRKVNSEDADLSVGKEMKTARIDLH